MYKKIIIQLLLLVTLFGIIIIVYLLYFNDQEKLVKPVLTPNEIPTGIVGLFSSSGKF